MRTFENLITLLFFLLTQFNLNAQVWPLKEWPTATPQSQSMNTDSLLAFDEALANGKYGYVDGMIITRHGKLVYEKKYTHDYDKIYGADANKRSGLNQLDPGGQYNYYNP